MALASYPTSPAQPCDEDAALAALLLGAEDAIEAAYAQIGNLAAALTAARRARNLSAVVGQPLFDRAARALVAVGGARGEVVGIHRDLQALAIRLNIRMDDFGDGRDKPPAGLSVSQTDAGLAA